MYVPDVLKIPNLIPEFIEDPSNIKAIFWGTVEISGDIKTDEFPNQPYSYVGEKPTIEFFKHQVILIRQNAISIKKITPTIIQVVEVNYSDINNVKFVEEKKWRVPNHLDIYLSDAKIIVKNTDLIKLFALIQQKIYQNSVNEREISEEAIIGGLFNDSISVPGFIDKTPAGLFATNKKIFVFSKNDLPILKKGFGYSLLLSPFGLSPFAWNIAGLEMQTKMETKAMVKENEIIKEIESYKFPTLPKEEIENISVEFNSNKGTLIHFVGKKGGYYKQGLGNIFYNGNLELKMLFYSIYFASIHPILVDFSSDKMHFRWV